MTAPDVNADVLLPCPFCGPGESVVEACFDDIAHRWRVYCGRCGCSTGIHPRDKTKTPAIEAWNRRAAHAALAGEVRELVEALKLCASVCAGETMSKSGLVRALEAAQAAQAKFTQEKP